jgi:myosin heavy subunit
MSSTQNDNKQKTLFIVVTVVLVGIIGFLIINQSQQSKQISTQVEQLDDAERLQLDLERQYYESLSELEEQRGSNEQLNALIEAQKEELKQQRDQISQLIKTKSDLNSARQQITQLKTQTQTYLVELEDLRTKNMELEEFNRALVSEKEELVETVQKERMEKDELVSEKTSLMTERERLAQTNKDLSRKVSRASMIAVSKIDVQGLQIRSSGKERKKARANSVDRLRICFDTEQNPVAETGYERFYIRIIGPGGVTLAVETLGSGTFISSESGDQIRYTQIKELDYDNTKTQACLNWDQDGEFSAGDYNIEIYNKGYLAGKSTFKLK